MQVSQLPYKLTYPIAATITGALNNTPIPVSTGSGTGLLDQEHGWQAVNDSTISPSIADFNALAYIGTAWGWWQSAGGAVFYDGTFSAAVGGYPSSALLNTFTFGSYYVSEVDNNTSNPTTGGANWLTLKMIPPVNSAAPQNVKAQGVSITASYSLAQTLTVTAPVAGYAVATAYTNSGPTGTGNNVSGALTNSVNGTSSADSVPGPISNLNIIVPLTAGESCTTTFTVSTNGSFSGSAATSIGMTLAFMPTL